MILYGCCRTPPDRVISLLGRYGVNKVDILPIGGTVCEEHDWLLVLDYDDIIRNLNILNSLPYLDTNVVLVTSMVRLSNLQGVITLDCTVQPDYFGSKFVEFQFEKGVPMRYTVQDSFIQRLITIAVEGSLLNTLMTWVYTLTKSGAQSSIKNIVVRWLFTGKGDFQVLQAAINSGSKLEPNKVAELMEIMMSSTIDKYIRAFRYIGQHWNGLDDIDTSYLNSRFGVDPFEINYCTHLYSKQLSKDL